MPLKQTNKLIARFGTQLKDGSITDDDLRILLAPATFTQSEGYSDPNKPLSDSNHSQWRAIMDFMQTIGPDIMLEEGNLHRLTHRIIELAPSRGENTFMRNSTLEKAFLAFEMTHSPSTADNHFLSQRMNDEFKGKDDIQNLKTVILSGGISFFKNPEIIADSPLSTDTKNKSTSLNSDEVVNKLINLCSEYQAHLKAEESSINNSFNEDRHRYVKSPIDDSFEEHGRFAGLSVRDRGLKEFISERQHSKKLQPITDKLQIVGQMLVALNSKADSAATRIQNMNAVLTPDNINTLKEHRSSSSKCLESILDAIANFINSTISKSSFAFWKSHGKALVDNVEDVSKQTPKTPN